MLESTLFGVALRVSVVAIAMTVAAPALNAAPVAPGLAASPVTPPPSNAGDLRPGEKTKLVYIDADGDQKIVEGTATQVRRGYLGVELTELTPELRTHFGAPEKAGVMVARVAPGSPAEAAGLQVGDIVAALDGKAVESSWDVRSLVRTLDTGATLAIEVWRDGGLLTLKASVEQRERSEVDYAPLLMKNGDEDRIIGFCTAPSAPITPSAPSEKGDRAEKPDAEGLDGTKAPLKIRLQAPVSPREQVLAKRLKALEKRLNELESRLPKN